MSLLHRFGLAQRLGLVLALLGTVVALVTGYYAHQQGKELLVGSTQAEILSLAKGMARRVGLVREDVSRDLSLLVGHRQVVDMLRQPSGPVQADLQSLLAALLRSNPLYLQVRLISKADYGMERIRVDRGPLGPVVIRDEDLHEKGHYDYVYQALELGVDQTYLSRLTINREYGSHQAKDQPTAILSMPVHGPDGVVLGVAVINVDLIAVFSGLSSELPRGYDLLLANTDGDYLVHPQAHKTFGFERGRRVLLQTDVPQAQILVEGQGSQLLTTLDQDEYAQNPVLAAFVVTNIRVRSGEKRLILGVTRPLEPIVAQANRLLFGTLQVLAGVIAVCGVLAFVLARVLVQPLEQMRQALTQFGYSGLMGGLPTQRSDEIGALAQGVQTMGQQIAAQMAQLRDNQEELQHLAQHDMLTGLPNRRVLQERLSHAIAQARRGGRTLALLFIDLDHFKDINDKLGHEAGDALLVALAQRLHSDTREADTVARMGGDEFVVLIDSPADKAHIVAIAEKLLLALQQPLQWQGHTLQVGASIGISQYPQDGQTVVDMMANADRAMYRVKAAGRNAYIFFSE